MAQVSSSQRTFYILLLAVLFLHVSFMAVNIRDKFNESVWTAPRPIKLKLLQEVAKTQETKAKKQIVQSEDSADKERPIDAAFLSDKDRKFDRQTVAKNVDLFKQAAKGNANMTQRAQKTETAKKKKVALKDLKLADVGFEAGEPIPHKQNRAPASEAIKGLENGNPLSEGFSASNDYVEEVALGDFTHMNTVEYKFYGFYHRIRQKLEQFWGKSIQEKAENLFKSGRRLPASENLITSLQITLNAEGEIIGVKVLGTSGVKELDDAAIDSFNQAGPFPNPPRDLLVNGKATIEWGFVVKS